MGLFHHDSEESRASDQINELNQEGGNEEHHKAKFSHELLSGAAAYEAAKAYEDHKKKNGKPSNHAEAKEIAAGLAG
ncbi:uncharacterized protein MELLADRAFT_91070 [Melampsora larici-populina 98AG31]|uniref:Uncharacterized protein n=1 Tax=Melampsora larici-populina (strain 98AG31 / pathotype 3-4-7) TaxID=747676 RepID=F4R713_MELLP|nr:uncharacterized protein MELLADRAFT_91070 [Melampsora larici-populina 98AG31]EGG11587.1 hypothetical protein MELLADRAFT_91070 [Melampsora larici-populina 98AG31]